ncbi:MAG TPA: DoxX family protein [Chloroflexota bacterium]|nr:DoxX family protein [Chloroflexota bacterium]
MTYVLWIIQIILAIVYLFTGTVKLITPIPELQQQLAFPGSFIRFLGVAEVLGAVGLILPGLVRILPWLTPLAAAGLLIIMVGATVVTAATMGLFLAIIPLVFGVLDAFVAYGRWQLAPQRQRSRWMEAA